MAADSAPIRRGVLQAFLAALLFGLTAPLIQRASAESGAFACGSLLYTGAAVAALLGIAARGRPHAEAPLDRRSFARLLVISLLGGTVAPALLVLGLQRVDPASGALLLALEAPSTVILAVVIYREHLDRQVQLAALLILAGGLVLAGRPGSNPTAVGALLVFGATLAWATDNALSRPLADRDPLAVVAGKGLIGAAASAAIALAVRERWPALPSTGLLFAAGALGYGVSLNLYLRAQRSMGVARTASVFASAPFLGSGIALLLGATWPGWPFVVAGALMGIGLWLHSSERHHHRHTHSLMEHDHAHTHDDGHHNHFHESMPSGPHSHQHTHEQVTHEHPHGEDLHHRHRH